MKITIIQDFLRSGGTERQSILLANAFAAAGHTTTLITFRPGGALAKTVSPQVTLRSLQPFDFRLDWFAPGLERAVATTTPDVVLCMGRMANCYGGMIQTALPDAIVVATMRTGKSLPARFRKSLQTVRHVVANSREARDALIARHGVPARKLSIIYNSLVFPPAASFARNTSLRSEYGATSATQVLLCVAMFRPEKNQRELIQIAAELPRDRDWQLWLAGNGRMRAHCEALATKWRLLDRVRFVGFHADPTPLYRAADIAVHASWSEALSNFLIEAQAHGLPAIAYPAQGIEECFLPDYTGWAIPRDDRAAFCAAIENLLDQTAAARAAIAAAARERARTLFDPDCNTQAYLDLFRRLSSVPTPA